MFVKDNTFERQRLSGRLCCGGAGGAQDCVVFFDKCCICTPQFYDILTQNIFLIIVGK